MTGRLQELRTSVGDRWESVETKQSASYFLGHKKEETWMRILDNSHSLDQSRNDKRRTLHPMLKSDQVVSFLTKTLEEVDQVVTQWNIDNKVNIENDGGQTDSLRRNTKKDFIKTLLGFIENRAIPKNFKFDDQYGTLSEFKNIEDLYNFLLEVSGRTDNEIKDFILSELPAFSWDNNFAISQEFNEIKRMFS